MNSITPSSQGQLIFESQGANIQHFPKKTLNHILSYLRVDDLVHFCGCNKSLQGKIISITQTLTQTVN